MKEPEAEWEGQLPPRRRLHSPNPNKWSRRFYGTLVFLFFALILALIGWFIWGAKS